MKKLRVFLGTLCSVLAVAAGAQAKDYSGMIEHVIGVTSGGQLKYSYRTYSNYASFVDVEARTGTDIGTITDASLSSTSNYGWIQNHFVAIGNGQLWHTIHDYLNPNWPSFGSIASQIGGSENTYTSVGTASAADGVLYVCATTNTGRIWLTRRNTSNGTWEPWVDVKSVVGQDPGTFTRVDCEASYDYQYNIEVVHIVGLTSDGIIRHTMKSSTRTAGLSVGWQTRFGNVTAATSPLATPTDIDCSYGEDGLHVVGTGSNMQQHAIRYLANGNWKTFSNIAHVAGNPGVEMTGAITQLKSSYSGSLEEHVFVVLSNGQIAQAVRQDSGGWVSYNNISTEVGDTNFFTRVSASIGWYQ